MPRQGTKAERRRARANHKPDAGAEVDRRLARLEEALAGEAERTEELLDRLERAGETIRETRLVPPEPEDPPEAAMPVGLENGLRLRRENVVPIDQPLALICQAQRSGGTLLARLFDGHPQCHAHPHELHIGDKRPHVWPTIDLDDPPESWFAKLREKKLVPLFAKGKAHVPLKAQEPKASDDFYPFMLPPEFQRTIFLDEAERRSPIGSEREVLNCYMTSLFNAWIDNQHLLGPDKRWVVAFSPRRAWGDGREKLFELYPDGRLISVLRDPLSWFSSAKERDPKADPEGLLEHWIHSADEMLEAHRRYPERFCVVRFDELVLETEATMRKLAGFLEIDYDPCLAVPTFNGYPVGANSSFEVRETGVVSDPVERYKKVLSAAQRELITERCDQRYREVLELTG